MVKNATLLFLLLLGPVLGKPVARVESIEGKKNLYYQVNPKAPWYRSHVEQNADIGNRFKTDAASTASIRFFLGGKVGLGKGCEVEVVNIRDAKTISEGLSLQKGDYWLKFDKDKIKQQGSGPVRIQTAGGVMGIRGTEFVLQVQEDGSTKLSLIEGEVEVQPVGGDQVAATPGMRITFGGGQPTVLNLYKVEELLDQVKAEVDPAFYQLRDSLEQTREALRDADLQVRTATAEARVGALEARAGILQGQDALRDAGLSGTMPGLDSAKGTLDQLDRLLSGMGEPSEKEAEENPRKDPVIATSGTVVTWPGTPNERYAVMVLDAQDQDKVYWVDETEGPQFTYPSDAEPLPAGQYVLRVVPVKNDKRTQKATDFAFNIGS